MKPHEFEMVRSLVQSILHATATLDQLVNGEPEPEAPPTKRTIRTLNDPPNGGAA